MTAPADTLKELPSKTADFQCGEHLTRELGEREPHLSITRLGVCPDLWCRSPYRDREPIAYVRPEIRGGLVSSWACPECGGALKYVQTSCWGSLIDDLDTPGRWNAERAEDGRANGRRTRPNGERLNPPRPNPPRRPFSVIAQKARVEDLKKLNAPKPRRVYRPNDAWTADRIHDLRIGLGVTQKAFGVLVGKSRFAVCDWEARGTTIAKNRAALNRVEAGGR